jgi:hypothetical protein
MFGRNIMEACEAREHGGDSKQNHQVEGPIMQAKEWTRAFGRCNPVKHTVTKQQSKHACEGPIRRTREAGSEWELIKILLEGDGNSNKMNTASNTRLRLTTQLGQAHVATGVPLDLGTNTQPSDLRTQRNTKPRVYRPTPGQTGEHHR